MKCAYSNQSIKIKQKQKKKKLNSIWRNRETIIMISLTDEKSVCDI